MMRGNGEERGNRSAPDGGRGWFVVRERVHRKPLGKSFGGKYGYKKKKNHK